MHCKRLCNFARGLYYATLQEDCMHFGAHQALLQCQLGRLCRAQHLLPKMIEISYACTTDLTTQSTTCLENQSAFSSWGTNCILSALIQMPIRPAITFCTCQCSNSTQEQPINMTLTNLRCVLFDIAAVLQLCAAQWCPKNSAIQSRSCC